jgi:hypothetical protein
MALKTRSQFYFGPEILDNEVYIDFDEGSGEIIATITAKSYSPETLADEIASAMSAAGSQTYFAEFNRQTRTISISAAAPFDLLINSGTHNGSVIWDKLGFTGNVDLTGLTLYTSDSAVGYVYKPQFFLLDYIPSSHRQEAVEASVNLSASGRREVVRYGTVAYMECTIDLINDFKHGEDSWLETNVNGVSDAVFFMQNITNNGDVEFMADRENALDFEIMRLESTSENSNGLGYRLDERLEYGSGYYSTGKLVFRKVD